ARLAPPPGARQCRRERRSGPGGGGQSGWPTPPGPFYTVQGRSGGAPRRGPSRAVRWPPRRRLPPWPRPRRVPVRPPRRPRPSTSRRPRSSSRTRIGPSSRSSSSQRVRTRLTRCLLLRRWSICSRGCKASPASLCSRTQASCPGAPPGV
ncbi:unnamed protein product, partial [Prorocentrum cordatum]